MNVMRSVRIGLTTVVAGMLLVACADHGEPGVGYSKTVPFQVVASGSMAMDEQAEPGLVVATPEQGVQAVLDAVPQAEEQLATADLDGKTLVLVTGGCQPDSNYVVELTSLVMGYGELNAVGRVVPQGDMGLQVLSVPYQIVAADPADLTVTEPGQVTLEGAERCGPNADPSEAGKPSVG
jgi:hypothetical protein